MKSRSQTNERQNQHRANYLRIIIATLFFFLAFHKCVLLTRFGLRPYAAIVQAAGAPSWVQYYIVLAIMVELYLAIGIWYSVLFKTAIRFSLLMTAGGICLSVYSLIFRLNSDCGCGLLGTNEYGLLGQKLIIGAVLIYLYLNRKQLNFD